MTDVNGSNDFSNIQVPKPRPWEEEPRDERPTHFARLFFFLFLASNKSLGIIQIFKSRSHFASPFHHSYSVASLE